MGQSQAARRLRRSNSSSSVASLSELKASSDLFPFEDTVDAIVDAVSTTSGEAVSHRVSNASVTSDMSDVPALRNDQHVLPSEKPGSVLTLMKIAELLCDLVMEVDSKYRVIPAHGQIDKFFQSEVEGRCVFELVPHSDREDVETALRTLSLTRVRLLRTVVLCDHGIGTIEAKLLLMVTSDCETGNQPKYVVGVRTEQLHGLSLPSSQISFESETSDTNTFAMPSASIVPGNITHEPPLGFNRQRRNSNNSLYSQVSQSIVPSTIEPPLGFNRQRRNSLNSRTSNTSHYSQGISEVSFNISRAPSVKSSTSLAYTASTISSALGTMNLRWNRKSSQRKRTHMSAISGFSLPSSIRNSKRQIDQAHQEVQTESEQYERGTQTESSHVPLTKPLRRPPPNPSSLRVSQRSSNSRERDRRPSVSSAQSAKSSCKSESASKTDEPSRRIGHWTSQISTASSTTRRATRAGTDTGRGRRASECSTSSSDLVIRHFEATPVNTIMFFLDTLTERINVHDTGFSCCFWHATIRTIVLAVSTLGEQACKGSYWLPSSGWQCVECFALNDVDEDECTICCGDRTPIRESRVHLTRSSNGSEVSD